MPFFVTTIDPQLPVQGSSQQFTFSSQQADAQFQLSSLFQPTVPNIPSNLKMDLLNASSYGYRLGVLTTNSSPTPTYLFSSVAPSNQAENSTLVSTPLMTFNENQSAEFKSYVSINAPNPTANSHLANKGWVNQQISSIPSGPTTIQLQGPVSGSGSLGSPVSTTFNLKLYEIDNSGDVDLKGYRVKNGIDPQAAQDLGTKNYIDNKTWTSNKIIDLASTVKGYALDQFAVPTADLSLNSKKITNLANPISNTDAANKQWVASQISAIPPSNPSITMTGDITGSGPLSSSVATTLNSTAVSTIAKTVSLDQFTVPAANLNLNSKRIISLADPTGAQDGSTKNYVDNKTWTTSKISDFSSAVSAFRLDQFAVPTADLSLNSKKITNLANPISNTDAANKQWVASQINSIGISSGGFTPTIIDEGGNDAFATSNGGYGYQIQRGLYVKIWRQVYVSICLVFGYPGTTPSYPVYPSDSMKLYLTGLPFNQDMGDFNIVPISYLSCSVNNIIQLYINMTSTTSWPILALYQYNSSSSTNNNPLVLTRDRINRIEQTTLTMNFCYRTAS